MFQTTQDPSSGSVKLYLTGVTGDGSIVQIVLYMVSVWLHIVTCSVCVYCTGWRGTSPPVALYTTGYSMQPNTDHTRDDLHVQTIL
jgi:hypothetical protein